MMDETVPTMAAVPKGDSEEFQLTDQELRLIRNFRALKAGARDMLVDLSEQYKRTLPAEAPSLQLVRSTGR